MKKLLNKKIWLIATFSIVVSSAKNLSAMNREQTPVSSNKARTLIFRRSQTTRNKNESSTPISQPTTSLRKAVLLSFEEKQDLNNWKKQQTLIPISQPTTSLGKAGLLSLGEKQDLYNWKNFLQRDDNYTFICLGEKKLESITHVLTINDFFYRQHNKISEFADSLLKINDLCSEKFSCPMVCNAFNHMINQLEFYNKIVDFLSTIPKDRNQELLMHVCKRINKNKQFSNRRVLTPLFNS